MKMRTGTKHLFLDIETYSEIDLIKCGVYRYVDDPSFDLLIFGYAYEDDDVSVIDLAQGEKIPNKVLRDLNDINVLKIAHNANFERTCLTKYLNKYMAPEEWLCTAVLASRLGMPRGLDAVGNVLGLKEDLKKQKIGKTLMAYFSKPCKPTKTNGERTKNLPKHDIDKWNLYKDYNKQDIVAERAILKRLESYPDTTKEEKELWCLDQRINDSGVLVETKLVANILDYYSIYKDRLLERAKKITNLENPGSIVQAKNWLTSKGVETNTLDKEAVSTLVKELKQTKEYHNVLEFLQIRQELGKTSVSKYEAIDRSRCSDSKIRGMLQFYGANRTGRWSGKIVQLQNLPQNKIFDLEFARNLIVGGECELAELCYPSVMNLFSQLIRTALIPSEDNVFIVADYSAIEARVIAWFAKEKWVMDVFATHGKIYEATAAKMYRISIEEVTHGSGYRKKGKIATLACGYGGGVGALTAMDSKGEIPEEEKRSIIADWRESNPNIVKFWYETEDNVIKAIMNPGVVTKGSRGLKFRMFYDTLFIKLPSDRSIAYKGAKIHITNGRKEVRYMGQNQTTQKWEEIATYGGKLVENIVQATARDCLATAMLILNEKGYTPKFHVHDEVVIEVNRSLKDNAIEEIKSLMALEEDWIKELILTAEAYACDYYMKD